MPYIPADIPFQQVLSALLDVETPFNPGYLQHFSDLEKNELASLGEIWEEVPAWRRKSLIEDIEQLGEDDTLLSFEALARFALKDKESDVRLPALRALWEYETADLIPTFIQLLRTDPSVPIRAAAASILGKYVYLGELEEINETQLHEIESSLLAIVPSQEEDLVRRRALEALGYSSRDEVPQLIEKAYRSGDKAWIASALFAMGRSAESRWGPEVLSMLDSPHPVIRAEAARAAGELELTSAVQKLIELLDDPDADTRAASIWSLSQLGGEGIQKKLQRLYDDSEDSDERKYIESALDNLTFNEEMGLLPIFDFSEAGAETDDELDDDDLSEYFDEELGEDFDDEFIDEFGEDFRPGYVDDDEELPGAGSRWLEEEDDVEDLD